MRPVSRSILAVSGLSAVVLALGSGSIAAAEQETKISHSKRGGILVSAEGYQFEVFFYPTGVRLYELVTPGRTVGTSKLTDSVSFQYPGVPSERSTWEQLQPDPAESGSSTSSLMLSTRLADAPEKTTVASFEITGLSGPGASTAAFRIPLEFVTSSSTADARISSEPNRVAGFAAAVARADSYETTILPLRSEAASVYSQPSTTPDTSLARNNSTTRVSRFRDWTTARVNHLPIAKPWLSPR